MDTIIKDETYHKGDYDRVLIMRKQILTTTDSQLL
jgi:hypothetical protein